MLSRFHAVSLPVRPSAPRNLAWPAKDAGSVRAYALDCTAWLADAGTTILLAIVKIDLSLQADSVECDGKIIRLRLWGGVAGNQPVVVFSLRLVNGCRENVSVSVPVQDIGVPVPSRTATVGPADPAQSGAGSALRFTYRQDPAAAVWPINHNLNCYPNVVVIDSSGQEVEGSLEYVTLNQVIATFSAPFAGQASCL